MGDTNTGPPPDLCQLPSGIPPGDVRPNFTDPEILGPTVIGVGVALGTVSLVLVIIRTYHNWRRMHIADCETSRREKTNAIKGLTFQSLPTRRVHAYLNGLIHRLHRRDMRSAPKLPPLMGYASVLEHRQYLEDGLCADYPVFASLLLSQSSDIFTIPAALCREPEASSGRRRRHNPNSALLPIQHPHGCHLRRTARWADLGVDALDLR